MPLDRHQNEKVGGLTGSYEGVTRCDWNLNRYRVERIIDKMKAQGWLRAGSTVAQVAKTYSLRDPAQTLAIYAPGHPPPQMPTARLMGPDNDERVWWVRGLWAKHIGSLVGWTLLSRAHLWEQLLDRPDLQAAIEATWKLGGVEAVRDLAKNLINEGV